MARPLPASNLEAVAAWLAEEERKKPPPPDRSDRVFTHTPKGVHSYVATPNSLVGGEEETADPDGSEAAFLRESGYRWLPQEEYAESLAQAQRAVEGRGLPPPGKLPFISGVPTHKARPTPLSQLPNVANPDMAEAMASAAALPRSGAAPTAVPPRPPPAVARAKRSREVQVGLTSQTGPQPELRTPTDRPYGSLPAGDRFRGLPPGVANFLRQRSGLADAQADANRRGLAVELASAFNQVGAGISGSRYDDGAWDNQRAAAGQPVEDLRLRSEEERSAAADQRAAEEAARAAELELQKFQYGQQRDKDEAQLERERIQLQKDIAEGRLRSEALDRGLRRQELTYRQREGQDLKQQMAQQRQAERQAREDEIDLQRLGAATSKAPFGEFQTALERIDKLIPGLPYGIVPENEPLGIRDRGARALSAVGGEFFMTDDGKAYATAIANLRDLIARMRSGAVLNEGEERHYLSLIGDHVFSDKRSAAEGINLVRMGLAQKLRDAQAGYQHVLDRYEAAGGTTHRAPIFGAPPARPTGRRITRPDGSVWEELDNGEAQMVSPPRRQ